MREMGPRRAGRRLCAVQAFCPGQNLDAGRIHSARADEVNRVEPPKAAEPKKEDTPKGYSS